MATSRWISIALLTPFWWASGLMLLALVADLFPRWRRRVFAVFNRLERRGCEQPTAVFSRVAA